VLKMGRNARKYASSQRAEEQQSTARRSKRAQSLGKSRVSNPAQPDGEPTAELNDDGRIGAALGGLLARTNERDPKGRYTRDNTGHLTTLEHSSQLWRALEPLKQEIIGRVRTQLAADTDDAPETLLGVIDAYAEARLLRSSAFVRLSQSGGFMTSKGAARALLGTWGAAFDREMRAAERLGLVRRARRAQTPIEWLQSLDDQQQKGGPNDDPSPDATEQPGRPRETDAEDEQTTSVQGDARMDEGADRDA
jgi:hypothetical protein